MPKRRPLPKSALMGLDADVTISDGTKYKREEAVRFMWTTGAWLEVLLLNEVQMKMEEMRRTLPRHARMFVEASRKIGKTRWALVAILLMVLRKQKAVCRLACETKQQALEIIKPQFDELLETCPGDLLPHYMEGEFHWPQTGSRLYLAGTDKEDQIRRLRGPKSDLTVIDEIGAHDCDIDRLINTILAPQMLDTGGNILLTGTPPESLDHPSLLFRADAAAKGRLLRFTIWDNPRLTRESIRTICAESNMGRSDEEVELILAGKLEGSPAWEREYMIRQMSDRSLRVTPNFRHTQDDCRPGQMPHVGQASMPSFADKYVLLDPGHVKDFFSAAFCFLDYGSQRLVVQREYCSLHKTTDEVMADLRAIEAQLWPRGRQPTEILRRIADPSNQQQITDFCAKGYQVESGGKSLGPEQMPVELQNRLNSDAIDGGPMIAIDPSCKKLIACMENGIFKISEGRKVDFRRTAALGHLDILAALAGGIRSVNWGHNPSPVGLFNHATQMRTGQLQSDASPLAQAFGGIYGRRMISRA